MVLQSFCGSLKDIRPPKMHQKTRARTPCRPQVAHKTLPRLRKTTLRGPNGNQVETKWHLVGTTKTDMLIFEYPRPVPTGDSLIRHCERNPEGFLMGFQKHAYAIPMGLSQKILLDP